MDKTQQTERPELEAAWLSVAAAAKLLHKTERTVRRYVHGEVSPPSGVETRIQDGRMEVRLSGRADMDGRPSKSVHRDMASLLERADMSEREVVRLRTVLSVKEEVLEAKEQVIQTLRERSESDAKTIHAMEALVGQLQLQAPRKARPIIDTDRDSEASPAKPGGMLWLYLLIVLVVLLGGLAFYMRWIP